MNKRTASLAALLVSSMAGADEVYLCKQDGKTLYTESPRYGECQRLELKTPEPSAEEVQRLQQEQKRKEAQRQTEEAQALEERKVRAEEATARAEERQARAAEEQARYQREQLRVREAEANRSAYPSVIYVTPSVPQHPPIPQTQTGINIGRNPPHNKPPTNSSKPQPSVDPLHKPPTYGMPP